MALKVYPCTHVVCVIYGDGEVTRTPGVCWVLCAGVPPRYTALLLGRPEEAARPQPGLQQAQGLAAGSMGGDERLGAVGHGGQHRPDRWVGGDV